MTMDKVPLRAAILARRRGRTRQSRTVDAEALRGHILAAVALRSARTVAGYVPVGAEPGSVALLDALAGVGVQVLLPVLRPDLDLDWAAYTGPDSLATADFGLREPAGPRLGRSALQTADVVLVPAVACDLAGHRLGRGGGSYDRALRRVTAGTAVAAVLYDDEVVAEVPVQPHDVAVTHLVTPRGGFRAALPDGDCP
jgi:5-formyltetrahydrofolate cyclo-ligase